jgi:hypothetical protein
MHPNRTPDPQVPEGTVARQDPASTLSKRAARRIIQRAFVLMGRDKALRHQIREADIITLWIVEDWQMEWTVFLRRGRFEVERRPAKRPDVTFAWPTAEQFFQQVDVPGHENVQVEILAGQEHPRFFQSLLRGFFACLRHVLANPIDDVGESLL